MSPDNKLLSPDNKMLLGLISLILIVVVLVVYFFVGKGAVDDYCVANGFEYNPVSYYVDTVKGVDYVYCCVDVPGPTDRCEWVVYDE